MAAVIESRGGKVEKFAGDAVMAVFGIPTVHEDDAERAVRAGLEMQARLRDLNPELAGRHGVELAMRVGVDTGEVIAGTGGDQLMVTGDVVNVAARLQQTAEPGDVVAGERAYLATRHSFRFEPLAAKALKGKSAAVCAWRVLEQTELVAPRGLPGVSTRLVGRQRELELLETLYRAAMEERRPRLVTVLGPAGIGKSRLTDELIAVGTAGGQPAAVYRGRCLPYGEGITYWALREILWNAAGILLDDSAAVAAEKVAAFVRGLLGEQDPAEAERVLFAVATTAGVSLPDNPLERMSPESIGEELGLAWPRLVSALAAEQPVILIAEDLHRGEPPLLDMLEHIVSRSTGPVLVVATGRPELAELRPAWSTRPAMAQIGLQPLTEAQAAELVEELVPAVGSAVRGRVLAAAEGNPFFAEEIVRHLLDAGVLARSNGTIVETGGEAPAVALPDTVRGLLGARVDALPAAEKRTLQDAAVVGRVFWAATLEAMRPDGDTRPALRALEDKGLVVTRGLSSSLPGHLELAFHHGLTREVAYESIPKGRRAHAHAGVARWSEQLAGDRRAEYVDLLAYHYEAAARPEDAELAWPDEPSLREDLRTKAIAALVEAGQAAMTRFAIDDALGFGDRALALARTEAERLAAVELKAQAAHAIVRADEAWGYYLEALELAERLGDVAAVGRLRANATLLWARYGGALSVEGWRERARELLERGLAEDGEEEVSFERGAMLAGRGSASWWKVASLDPEVAERGSERAVAIAEQIGSSTLLAYALDSLASIVQERGFCESARMAQRALHVANAIEDRVEAHEMFVTAAISFSEAGDFEAAARTAAEASRLAAQLGSHRGLHAGSAATIALLPAGRIEELLSATEQAAELVAEEDGQTCNHGLTALAGQALAVHEREGRAAGASVLAEYDATKPLTTSFSQLRTIEILRPLLGRDEARRRLEAVEELPQTVATRIWVTRTGLQVRALAGESDEVERLAAEARELAETACAPALASIAGWADAVRLAAEDCCEEAEAIALAATESLDSYGERYTAARLFADFVQVLGDEAGAGLVEDAARRLEAVGALTSAVELRAGR
jgi:hypothetical protein